MKPIFYPSVLMLSMLSANHANALEAPHSLLWLKSPVTKEKSGVPVLSGKAYRLSEKANEALADGQIWDADSLINEALLLRPDSEQLRNMTSNVQQLMAQQASQAASQGDLARADEVLMKACALHPDNQDLGLLSVEMKVRLGDQEQARVRADAMRKRFPQNTALMATRGFLLQNMKHYPRAIEDFSAALAHSGLAREQRYNIRLALADSALRADRPKVAWDALQAINTDNSYGVQIRIAQSAALLGKDAAANAALLAADKYATTASEHQFAQQSLRQLQLYLASPKLRVGTDAHQADALLNLAYKQLAEGQPRPALSSFQQSFALEAAPASAYADAGFLAQRVQEDSIAQDLLNKALSIEPRLNAEAEQVVRLSLADTAAAQHRAQAVLEMLQPLQALPSYAVQTRLADAHLDLLQAEAALLAAQHADEFAQNDEQHAHAQSQIVSARNALQDPNWLAHQASLNQAYAALAAHQESAALDLFKPVFADAVGSAVNYADAAYAAKRIGENQLASDWFAHALELDKQRAESVTGFSTEQVIAYERELQQLNRQWGFSVSVLRQKAPQNRGRTRISNFAGGAELYWQPYFNNGRLAQLYVNGFDTFADYTGVNGAGRPRQPSGASAVQAAVGVRYKPFGDYGLIFSAEKQVTMPNQINPEPLLRISYASDQGTEIKPVTSDWKTFQVSASINFYLASSQRAIYTGEASYGHSFHLSRVSDRLVLYPHVVVTGYVDTNANGSTVNNPLLGLVAPPLRQESWNYGPGVKMRYWLPEHGKFSSSSVIDARLQYHTRRGPGSNVQIGEGWLFSLAFWY